MFKYIVLFYACITLVNANEDTKFIRIYDGTTELTANNIINIVDNPNKIYIKNTDDRICHFQYHNENPDKYKITINRNIDTSCYKLYNDTKITDIINHDCKQNKQNKENKQIYKKTKSKRSFSSLILEYGFIYILIKNFNNKK